MYHVAVAAIIMMRNLDLGELVPAGRGAIMKVSLGSFHDITTSNRLVGLVGYTKAYMQYRPIIDIISILL